MLGKPKRDIVLIGGGGHSKSVIDVIECNDDFRIVGIVDIETKLGSNVLNIPISWKDEDIPSLVNMYKYFHISLGHILFNYNRIKLYNLISTLGGIFPIIKAYDAHVSLYAEVGAGTFVGHKAVINAGAKIGFNNIINTGAIVEHDSQIGNNCHISTMATINANCEIGESCFVSSHVIINRGIQLPASSLVYSGAVVTKNFKETGLSLKGIPAKIVS